MLYFLVLWGLLVLVQISALLLVDFTTLFESVIITGVGTMLTLYLGLKVERKRVKREEENKKQDEIRIFHDALTANEVRAIRGYNPAPMIMNTFSEPDNFFLKYGSAHLVVDDEVEVTEGALARKWVNESVAESNAIQFIEPSPTPNLNLLPEDWGVAADADETEMSPTPEPDICKHCYRQIKGSVHAEGMNRGKMRCDPEDTLGGFGYNAEPSDADCGKTCLGYK